MSFIKELNSFFFRANAPINPNVPGDHKDNLAKEGVPSQDTMERLLASKLSFRERKDRAKQPGLDYDGNVYQTPDEDFELVGHVQFETDVLAKAWTSGIHNVIGEETAKTVHARQLPDVNSDNQTTTPLDGVTGDVANAPAVDIESITSTIDPTESRRNNFLLRISAALQGYLNSLVNNLSFLNTFVFGTGGRGAPGENGSGLSGLIYGTDGTPGSPGADGLITYIFGAGYDPSDPSTTGCPSIMCDLYGENGLPGVPGLPGTGGLSSLIPLGLIQMYGGNSAPVGGEWMICNGATVNSVADPTLAGLFSIIGTTFGGTGAADFNLPDMQEKFPIGAKSGTTPLGQTAVNNSFTLLETQVPFRSHGHSDTYSLTGSVLSSGSHYHTITGSKSSGSGASNATQPEIFAQFDYDNMETGRTGIGTPDSDPGTTPDGSITMLWTNDGAHSHTDDFAIAGSVTNHAGIAASVPVDNRPSYLSLTYMIKAR